MTIGEDELRERLQDEDDDRAEAALRQHFVPVPRAALTYSWCPAAELEPAPSDEEGWKERWFQRMVDLANETEQRLRRRRYQWRRRRHPRRADCGTTCDLPVARGMRTCGARRSRATFP